ncbi:unnamed protein product [Linum tenue]|uniref:Uncharacterized protein n=1 Tax=Linum tenue TaxID=586396 RepID=A0AAV0QKY3_9ROSI|nr:unnamed protein product [Linum tenue]
MAKRLIPAFNRILVEKTVPPSKTTAGILLPEKTSKVNHQPSIAPLPVLFFSFNLWSSSAADPFACPLISTSAVIVPSRSLFILLATSSSFYVRISFTAGRYCLSDRIRAVGSS